VGTFENGKLYRVTVFQLVLFWSMACISSSVTCHTYCIIPVIPDFTINVQNCVCSYIIQVAVYFDNVNDYKSLFCPHMFIRMFILHGM